MKSVWSSELLKPEPAEASIEKFLDQAPAQIFRQLRRFLTR